jgi:hypothetical protein
MMQFFFVRSVRPPFFRMRLPPHREMSRGAVDKRSQQLSAGTNPRIVVRAVALIPLRGGPVVVRACVAAAMILGTTGALAPSIPPAAPTVLTVVAHDFAFTVPGGDRMLLKFHVTS